MANFLPSSCTLLLSTTSHHRISSAKPSHLLPNARRSRRFHVSCSGGTGGVDRRNMLLGLGGLYGAANFISDVKADSGPVEAPDLSKCGQPRDVSSGDPLNVNACPPPSDNIVEYMVPNESPPETELRVRPPAHDLPREYLAKYEEAIRRMKALDVLDPTDPRGFTQQANIHCAYCNGAYSQVKNRKYAGTTISVHGSWLFFPFHRWYLYFYERILGKMIGDPTFALPFWNYDSPAGMHLPGIFDNPASPLYNANRDPLHRPPATLDLSLRSGITDETLLKENNVNIMYSEMIGSVNTTEDFMGMPYKFGDLPPGMNKGGTVERGSHTGVHVWVGNPMNKYREDMGNFYSAGRDPAFFSLHSNVDRLWTLWQSLPSNVSKTIDDPDFTDASFLFYDEEKRLVKVKVGQCFDNTKLGYKYQDVPIPWKYYRPSTNLVLPKDVKPKEEITFPFTVDKITRVSVKRSGAKVADEQLVLRKIESDRKKFVKFDVYVNDDPEKTENAEYVGTYSHLMHRSNNHEDEDEEETDKDLKISLKKLYENLNIGADKEKVVVSLVPRSADYAKIDSIEIVNPQAAAQEEIPNGIDAPKVEP